MALHGGKFNPDFVRGFMSRLEWGALVSAKYIYIYHKDANSIRMMIVGYATSNLQSALQKVNGDHSPSTTS